MHTGTKGQPGQLGQSGRSTVATEGQVLHQLKKTHTDVHVAQ